MKFEPSKIVYSSRDSWDELVSITFVKGSNYLSLNSLAYEEEIGIEWNDQVNFMSLKKTDFEYELLNNKLQIHAVNTLIQNNLFEANFEIELSTISNTSDLKELRDALIALKEDFQ